MPSMPPAPGLFSTITCWPRPTVSRCAMKRAMKSEPPPGANGDDDAHRFRRVLLGLGGEADRKKQGTKQPTHNHFLSSNLGDNRALPEF
jgi:hypothetical protein